MSLSPWEEFHFFRPPVLTTGVQVSSTSPQLLVSRDVHRVILAISYESGTGSIGVGPEAGNKTPLLSGLNLNSAAPQMWLMQRNHGPLPQLAWYGKASGPGLFVCTLEVHLNEWPEDDTPEISRWARLAQMLGLRSK